MIIPDKIKLGGHTITIERHDATRQSSPGEYNDYCNRISIISGKDAPECNKAEALLHEIIETVKSKNNLVIDHTHLTVLSEMLFQVIRDNNLDFRCHQTHPESVTCPVCASVISLTHMEV